MNTYDDNLHSAVVTSLSSQELEQKKINAQLTASMFTLYYAEGARITAAEKLEQSQTELVEKAQVKEQAVINANISTNMLMSADQSKSFVDQAVTSTAVGAANVQVAANAVLRLASDMGSIYSIVNAADFGTEIFTRSLDAYGLMNRTAYAAEKLSQHAMEGSYKTAEVSMNTVADMAKVTNTSVDSLLKIAESEYDAVSQTMAQDNAKLATASANEKKAEGSLEDVDAEFRATNQAYNIMNNQLNLHLRVPLTKVTSDSFVVKFNAIQPPFRVDPNEDSDKKDKPYGYPVEFYYLMIVKDSNKGTFTISDAENLLDKDSRYWVKINPKNLPRPLTRGKSKLPPVLTDIETPPISIAGRRDSDGDKVVQGENYVVFVMATYLKTYKKIINNFEDFLSAPSPMFCMTYKLVAPSYESFAFIQEEETVIVEEKVIDEEKDIQTPGKDKQTGGLEFKGDIPKEPETKMTRTFTFKIRKKANEMDVEYRCMFVPHDNKHYTKGLLSVNGLKTIYEETQRLEAISEKYDPEIEAASTEYNNLLNQKKKIEEKIEILNQKIDVLAKELENENNSSTSDKKKKEKELTESKLEAAHHEASKKSKAIKNALSKLNKSKGKKRYAISKISFTDEGDSGVFMNLQIAEQVPAGNYTKADLLPLKLVPPAKPKKGAKGKDDKEKDVIYTYAVTLEDNTTDNFGNPILVNHKYKPVVLSYSTAVEEVADQFTNAMSNYEKTEVITIKENL